MKFIKQTVFIIGVVLLCALFLIPAAVTCLIDFLADGYTLSESKSDLEDLLKYTKETFNEIR
jgi:hypothetical protein